MRLDLHEYRAAVAGTSLRRRFGEVRRLAGLAAEVHGLEAEVGQLCRIHGAGGSSVPPDGLLAEVVAVHGAGVTVMAYAPLEGLRAGNLVEVVGAAAGVGVGPALLGRVIDPFGVPLDGLPAPATPQRRSLRAGPSNPMQRPRITRALETGIRAIDALLTVGQGQRVGIFAGSGVGKSTLLGMIARHVQADVNVIALVGERGREVREFIDRQLGPAGLARSVVVVAASDQPALTRVRAAHVAFSVAEYFRDRGQQVLLTMDSITRLAMARREIGLAAGEPPTVRGYTPSVFAELPALCERAGTGPGGGAVTALMTVLVEGDDLNEPVADSMRATLDGHIVLSRLLAQAGQYPAIDVLQSASRVMPEITSSTQRRLAAQAVGELALLERNRQMVDLGAYRPGSNPPLDRALRHQPRLSEWLCQRAGGVPAAEALGSLAAALEVTARQEAHDDAL